MKIDNDFKKKSKDINKPKLVEIMKTVEPISHNKIDSRNLLNSAL